MHSVLFPLVPRKCPRPCFIDGCLLRVCALQELKHSPQHAHSHGSREALVVASTLGDIDVWAHGPGWPDVGWAVTVSHLSTLTWAFFPGQ